MNLGQLVFSKNGHKKEESPEWGNQPLSIIINWFSFMHSSLLTALYTQNKYVQGSTTHQILTVTKVLWVQKWTFSETSQTSLNPKEDFTI